MKTNLGKIIADLRAAADALESARTPPRLDTYADRILARRARLAAAAEEEQGEAEGSRGGAAYRPSPHRRRRK